MFSCRYCGFDGQTATVEHEDPEAFLSALLLWISEKIYRVRLLVETHRHGGTIVVGIRPCGSMTFERRRSWSRLRDELLLPGFVASGVVVLPQIAERAWDKWPMVTLKARIAGSVPEVVSDQAHRVDPLPLPPAER